MSVIIVIFNYLFALVYAYKKTHRYFDNNTQSTKQVKELSKIAYYILAIIFTNAVFYQIFVLNTVNQSVEFISMLNLILAGLLAIGVYKLFSNNSWSDIVSDAENYEKALLIFRPFVLLVLFSVLVLFIFGYITLAHHFIFSLVFSILVIIHSFILKSAFAELVSYILRIKSLRMKYGLTILSLQKFKFWSLFIFNILLFFLTLVILLVVWGVPPYKFVEFTGELYSGIKVGELTFSIEGIIKAIFIFMLVVYLTRYLRRLLLERILPQSTLNIGTQNSIATLTSYFGWVIAISLSFAALGIGFQNIAIIAGALSVGIGFGLQNIVNNFVSGLILLFEQPIKVGDWVKVGAHEGYVQKLNFRSTEIKTFKKSSVIIPNADLISQPVMNMTFNSNLGRVEVPISLHYKTDLNFVKESLIAIAKGHKEVLTEPHPEVLFMNFSADRIDFELRCFIEDINYVYQAASALRFKIFEKLKIDGIELPLPQQVLHLQKDNTVFDDNIAKDNVVNSNTVEPEKKE